MTAPPIYGVYSKDTTLIVMDEVLQGLRAGPARTWEQGVVNASSRLYELQRYGGIGDGTSHPLSERYATLAAAQVVYPFALALTEEIDTCAIRAAIASMPATGGTIRGGDGFVAMIDRQVILAKAKVKFAEAGFKFTAAPVLTSGTDLGMFFIGDGATDVQWEFVTFDAAGTAGGSLNNYFLWWQAGVNNDRGAVRHCRFTSLPGGGTNANGAVLFTNGCDDCEAISSSFFDCPGAVFTQGARTRIASCMHHQLDHLLHRLRSKHHLLHSHRSGERADGVRDRQ
jgi:hypothetical protein